MSKTAIKTLEVLRHRMTVGLLVLFCASWVATTAHAVPIPFANRTVQLTAREQPIAAFLQDLFGTLDVPVSVSPTVKGAVNGNFIGPAAKVYQGISRAFNLVEYYDGAVLHVYTPQDMTTRTLPVTSRVSQRVVRAVSELRLPDTRNTLRTTREGALIVSGTRRFIEQVEEITSAQMIEGRSVQVSGVKVYYLRYAWAQDVTMSLGGRQVMLPGVASIVRALMTNNSQSQLSVTTFEQPALTNVPSMRNQAAPRQQGTLGGPNADPQHRSGPTVAAVYGAGAQAGAAGAGGAAYSGSVSGDMPRGSTGDGQQQSRVEADARMNAVIVRDSPERLSEYAQLIAELDVEPQAIQIEATIIDVNVDKMRALGINWRYTQGGASLLFGNGSASDLQLSPTTAVGAITPMGQGGFISAVLGNASQFITRINALQDQGAAKVVSSPQVLTLSNVEAVFDNSQTFYVRVAGRDQGDLFNVSAGTTLRVTPHVFRDRGEVRIKMLVAIDDGSLSTRTVDTLPVVDRSSINTQALIFEGESLLVGGITRVSNGDFESKVPILGDVPVLGALFRNTRKESTRIERMFLISPRLSAPARAASSRASSGRQLGLAMPAVSPVAPTPVPASHVVPRRPLPSRPLQRKRRLAVGRLDIVDAGA